MFTARREMRRRMEPLRGISFLTGCTSGELARIDRLGTPIPFRPGRTLTREGAVGRECFVTLEGVAIVERAGQRIGTIGAGEIAGEMALLDKTTRNATVVASTPMQLLVLSVREFDELLEIAPSIEATLARIANERRTSVPVTAVESTGSIPTVLV
jgi:CRP/FNR family cyclic AMP-dependent transcriptional regulator